MRHKVAVVIPNYNGMSATYRGRAILVNCLESLGRTRGAHFDTIVVDDGSTDDSVRVSRRYGADIAKVDKAAQHNFSKVANAGFRYAIRKYDPDWIVLLNNDIILDHPNWLEHALSIADRDEKVGSIGVKLLNPDGSLQEAGTKAEYSSSGRVRKLTSLPTSGQVLPDTNRVYDITMSTSCVWFISRDLIRKIGMFDERYVDFAGSADSDYFICAERAGFKAVFDGATSAVHLGSFTKKKESGQVSKDRYFNDVNVNQMYMTFKLFTPAYGAISIARWVLGYNLLKRDSTAALGFRVRDRILWRIKVSFHGITEGYGLYKDYARGPKHSHT